MLIQVIQYYFHVISQFICQSKSYPSFSLKLLIIFNLKKNQQHDQANKIRKFRSLPHMPVKFQIVLC